MANFTSNSTHSDSITDNPALAAPVVVVVVIILVALFAVVVVLLYKRNRQARVRRLRESAQIAARRLQTAIQLKQVNIERGPGRHSKKLVQKPPQEKNHIKDKQQHLKHDTSPTIVAFNKATTNRPLVSLQDHNAASAVTHSCFAREPSPNCSVLDDVSHIAVVNHDLSHVASSPYDAGVWRGYMSGEMRFYYNTADNTRYTGVHNTGNGYSSSEIEGWV